jgi:hypothetical protein
VVREFAGAGTLGTGSTHLEKWEASHESAVHEAIPGGCMGEGRADGARTSVPRCRMVTAALKPPVQKIGAFTNGARIRPPAPEP